MTNHRIKNKNLESQLRRKYIYYNEGMHPRKFCRRWFGLEFVEQDGRIKFTESQILAMESEHGYRKKCINLIAKILQIKPNTIQRWGKGVEFNKIPSDKCHRYQVYLGYVDSLRVLTISLAKYDEALVLKIFNNAKLLNNSSKSVLQEHNISNIGLLFDF